MKSLLLIALLVFPVFSQTPCKLSVAQSPVIRGLKLGMPKGAAIKVLGSDQNVFQLEDLMFKDSFTGVQRLAVSFDPNNLVFLNISYDPQVKWDSPQEFAANLSHNLGLPLNAWRYYSDSAEMHCSGFNAVISSTRNFVILSSHDSPLYKKEHFKP